MVEKQANEEVNTHTHCSVQLEMVPCVCVRACVCVCVCVLQLSVMEQRCRSVVSEKNSLEERLAEAERAKRSSEKKIQQVLYI